MTKIQTVYDAIEGLITIKKLIERTGFKDGSVRSALNGLIELGSVVSEESKSEKGLVCLYSKTSVGFIGKKINKKAEQKEEFKPHNIKF